MAIGVLSTLRHLRRAGFSTHLSLSKQLQICNKVRYSTSYMSTAPSTVDKDDVERHTRLYKQWWDLHGPMRALHAYNLIRVPFVRDGLVDCKPSQRVVYPLSGKEILDVGCGGGILSEPLAKLGAEVTGIDASKELIHLARAHSEMHMKNNLPKYFCTNIEEHALRYKEKYDAVVASEIIEHVNEKELFIQSCIETLKPGGRIFFTTPNRTKLAELCVIYLAENVLQMVPKGTHQIEKFITPPELSLVLERNNCQVEVIHGIMYNALTNRWMWFTFDHLAYALQAVKLPTKTENASSPPSAGKAKSETK